MQFAQRIQGHQMVVRRQNTQHHAFRAIERSIRIQRATATRTEHRGNSKNCGDITAQRSHVEFSPGHARLEPVAVRVVHRWCRVARREHQRQIPPTPPGGQHRGGAYNSQSLALIFAPPCFPALTLSPLQHPILNSQSLGVFCPQSLVPNPHDGGLHTTSCCFLKF